MASVEPLASRTVDRRSTNESALFSVWSDLVSLSCCAGLSHAARRPRTHKSQEPAASIVRKPCGVLMQSAVTRVEPPIRRSRSARCRVRLSSMTITDKEELSWRSAVPVPLLKDARCRSAWGKSVQRFGVCAVKVIGTNHYTSSPTQQTTDDSDEDIEDSKTRCRKPFSPEAHSDRRRCR